MSWSLPCSPLLGKVHFKKRNFPHISSTFLIISRPTKGKSLAGLLDSQRSWNTFPCCLRHVSIIYWTHENQQLQVLRVVFSRIVYLRELSGQVGQFFVYIWHQTADWLMGKRRSKILLLLYLLKMEYGLIINISWNWGKNSTQQSYKITLWIGMQIYCI